MAAETFTFNVAKGRTVELYSRVENADPANCALIVVPLSACGSEAQGQDLDTLAAVLGDANFTEQTGDTWMRQSLVAADLASPSPNDTDNRYDVALPEIDWGTPAAANDVAGFLVCYDSDTTAGTDANIIPLTCHAKTVATDGNQVTQNAGNFLQAS